MEYDLRVILQLDWFAVGSNYVNKVEPRESWGEVAGTNTSIFSGLKFSLILSRIGDLSDCGSFPRFTAQAVYPYYSQGIEIGKLQTQFFKSTARRAAGDVLSLAAALPYPNISVPQAVTAE